MKDWTTADLVGVVVLQLYSGQFVSSKKGRTTAGIVRVVVLQLWLRTIGESTELERTIQVFEICGLCERMAMGPSW